MKRRWIITTVTLVLLLLLSGPTLASAALTNGGVLSLRDGLMTHDESAPGTYAHYDALPAGDTTARAVRRLQQAVTLDGESLPARWALGRTALAVGDADTAARALHPLITQAARRPLLYDDVLTALSRGGRPESVLALHEAAPPPQPAQVVSDTVALAVLDQATRGQGEGETNREGEWEKVLELRPGDLYANYRLWKEAPRAGDVHAATAYGETLTHFPLEAINPTDERLLEYAAQVIPRLFEEKVWDPEKMLHIVSYLVRQHNRAAGVECLVDDLTARYPAEADWLFYRAELYQRRGELDEAEEVYRRVLAVDGGYAHAYVRLGLVAEDRGRGPSAALGINSGQAGGGVVELVEAAGWYNRYHEVAPEDLVGLKRLAEVCGALESEGVEDESCAAAAERVRTAESETRGQGEGGRGDTDEEGTPAAVLGEALAARTDDRRIVAELLGVRVEDVALGPNLVENGGFEAWSGVSPEGWQWSAMFSGEPFNAGAFVGGADALLPSEGERAARVDGFWVQREEDKSPARAGFWQRDEISLEADKGYLVSLDYLTTGVSEGRSATVWVGRESRALWAGDHSLSPTNGEWRHFAAVGWHRSEEEAAIRPLVRSFATGSVAFDNVRVCQISLAGGVEVEVDEARFWVEAGG